MSSARLRRALLERMASQWAALGVGIWAESERTIVDLEALVAMTAEQGREDVRLLDAATDWCVRYGRFVHAGRLATVSSEIRASPERVGEFAATVAGAGGPRWPMATSGRSDYVNRQKVLVIDLRRTPCLLWRFRAAFGVNARADVLTVLVARPGVALTLADLARSVRFTKRNVAIAVEALRLAGLVEATRIGNEDRIRLNPDSGLRQWFGEVEAAAWVDWVTRYRVALRVLRFLHVSAALEPVARIVAARTLAEELTPELRRGALPELDISAIGDAFGRQFDGWVEDLITEFAET